MLHDPNDIDFRTLDLLPYGVIVLDASGTVLYYNEREQQIAGRERSAVVGRNFFLEIAPCTSVQEFQAPFRAALQSEERLPAFRFRFPFSAQPRDVEITLTGFRNQGDLLCLVSVADVTEQQAVRERILQSERLRQAGEVAMGVAHNFNNLLMVVSGNAGLLLRTTGPDDPARRRLERIQAACDDGAQLMRRIGDAARFDPLPAASVADLAEVLAACVDLVDRADAVHRLAGEDSRPVLVNGDAASLREVALNLLRNALDAIGPGGRVEASAQSEGAFGVLRVRDDGPGMTPAVAERAFLPLFTTKGEGGTGMGLATCHAIAHRHGGDIRLDTAPGRGTTVTLRIPAAAAARKATT
jgi:photoactive yellow protein